MSLKPFNSVDGISVGETPIEVIYANGDVSAANLVVSGTSNLGPIGNITITGGTSGQVLTTDGAGNLSFRSSTSNSAAPMPYMIPTGESYIVANNFQGLFFEPIDIEGEFEVDGILIDVSGGGSGNGGTANALDATISNVSITGGANGYVLSTDGSGVLSWVEQSGGGTPGGSNTQVQYNNAGALAGNSTFTFDSANGILSAPNIVVTGNITPSANVTYSLGNSTNRFNNLYLAGNTIVMGGASISANATAITMTNPAGGNFVFAGSNDASTSNLVSGNSNIILTANGNINMAVAGNANLLRLSGAGFYSNSTSVQYKAPLINQGGNPNGTQLTSNDGKDRGSLLNYYSTFPATAFMGWDNSNGEFAFASEVTVSNDVINVENLGNIRAGYIFGNVVGNISGNFTVSGVNTQVIFNDEGVANGAAGFTFNKTTNAISMANTLTAFGTITGANLTTAGQVSATGNGTFGNLTTYGTLTAIGTATAGNLYSGGTIQTVGTGTFGNVETAGDVAATGNISGANLSTSGSLNVTGNATIGGNLIAVTANYSNFSGNLNVGNDITGIHLYPNVYASLRTLNVYAASGAGGNITTANISTTNITATTANTTTLNASSANVTGNIKAGNANLGNLVEANFFSGDGHLISNLTIEAGSQIINGTSDVSIAPSANITINANGVTNAVVVTGTNTTFARNVIVSTGNVTLSSGNLTVSSGAVSGTGTMSAARTITADICGDATRAGTVTTAAQPNITSVGTLTSLSATGNINGGNINSGIGNFTGNINALNANLGNLVTANFLQGDGYLISNLTVSAGSAITNGNSNVNIAPNADVTISSAGNANVVTVTGNSVVINKTTTVSNLVVSGNANVANVNATRLSVQTALNVNSDITANGTISANTLNINADAPNNKAGSGSFDGNLYVGTYLFVSGYSNLHTINASSLNLSGSIDSNATVHGNYVTAALGMSTANLTASDATIDSLIANAFTVNGNADINGNLSTNNLNGGNLVTANFFSGDGYLLSNLTVAGGTSIVNGSTEVAAIANGNVAMSISGISNVVVVTTTGANISGTIRATGNANVGNVGAGVGVFTGNVSTANLSVAGNISASGNVNASGNLSVTGTASTGAITSTGNITALNANLGNLVEANFFSGDGYLLTNLTIPAGTAIINGNSNVLVTYSGNVNITARGVANVLTVANTGVTVSGDLDTTGNISGLRFSNGTSNIAITNNGPVVISAQGNNQVVSVTGAGANVYGALYAIGTASVSGNANIGNIGVSGLVVVAGNITGGNLDTGGRLTVGSNANVGNLGTTGLVTAVGNVSAGNLLTTGIVSAGGNIIGANLVTTGTANANTLYIGTGGANINGYTKITGNIDVTGNFNVTGNLNYSNVTDLVVGDPLIYIGEGNPGDAYDLGIVASFVNSGYKHTGIARNHTNGTWTFFTNVVAEPTTVIDWANATMAPMQAGNITASNISVTGNISGNLVAPGSNTQVTFNDAGIVNATAGLTFDKSSNALAVVGNITGANFVSTGLVTTTGNVVGGNIVTTGLVTTTGNVVGGNIVTTGLVTTTGNVVSGNIVTSGLITATGNIVGSNLVTTGSANVGTLSVTGITNLGAVGNVKIGGGTSGYVLQTDGAGNLSWTAQTGGNGGGGGGGGGTSGYSTQTFTGNGVQTTATVSSGTTANSAIVTENGVLQTPGTDYTVSGTTLTFATAPASGVLVQIRELAQGGAVGGGTNQVFQVNDQAVTANYTIPTGKSAMSAGPITISDGVVVTIPSGSKWVVL